MKRLARLFLLGMLAFFNVTCQNKVNKDVKNTNINSVTMVEEAPKKYIVDAFFKDFQEKNDGWTKTVEGHKKLADAFKEKFVSDLDFAKACATYNTIYKHSAPIRRSSSITSYSKKSGEEGEIKSFDFVIDVDLIKPLYNGQKKISVKYEIINTIPSTVEEHWKPYVKNANYSNVFDSYLKSSYDATLNLGCYIITEKE